MAKNSRERTEEGRPITREKIIELSLEHAEAFKIFSHEATKITLKRLGNIRDELERIFQEQCRHCRHRETRPDSPAFWCDHEVRRGDVVALSCNYKDCPYVNREVL